MNEMKKCPYCGEEILAEAKKCKYCGEWLPEETKPAEKEMTTCPVCAEPIEKGTKVCPYCHEILIQDDVKREEPPIQVPPSRPQTVASNAETNAVPGFFAYYFVDTFIKHYADFKGKISRKQFWMGYLCYALLIVILLCIDKMIGSPFIITAIGSLVLTVPCIAFIVRRLHDIGKSGWWILIYLVPLIGTIWLLILLCKKGETQALHTKHSMADFIVWGIGVIIVVISFISPGDNVSYTDRQPLYPDGTTASLYDDEYLTYLADYKVVDEKTTPDGKHLLIREDAFGSDWEYMSYTWLCIEDGDVYVPLVLVGDWEGTRYKDFSILDNETIRIELVTGQDTPYMLETITYNINKHKIVDRQQSEYWGDEDGNDTICLP